MGFQTELGQAGLGLQERGAALSQVAAEAGLQAFWNLRNRCHMDKADSLDGFNSVLTTQRRLPRKQRLSSSNKSKKSESAKKRKEQGGVTNGRTILQRRKQEASREDGSNACAGSTRGPVAAQLRRALAAPAPAAPATEDGPSTIEQIAGVCALLQLLPQGQR